MSASPNPIDEYSAWSSKDIVKQIYESNSATSLDEILDSMRNRYPHDPMKFQENLKNAGVIATSYDMLKFQDELYDPPGKIKLKITQKTVKVSTTWVVLAL